MSESSRKFLQALRIISPITFRSFVHFHVGRLADVPSRLSETQAENLVPENVHWKKTYLQDTVVLHELLWCSIELPVSLGVICGTHQIVTMESNYNNNSKL